MRSIATVLLFCAPTAEAWAGVPTVGRSAVLGRQQRQLFMAEEPPTDPATSEFLDAGEAPPSPPAAPAKYDVSKLAAGSKQEGGGSGFNQFDPVMTATGFISRRFGLVGGLAVVGLLAAVEGNEIVKAALEGLEPPVPVTGETITTASGLKYIDQIIATSGPSPTVGNIVGFNAKVSIGDQVILDSFGGKPVAFKYGQRPFQNVVCEGLEEGIRGMKAGGKRRLLVPQNLAPPGVTLPPGVPLTFDLELTEVLSSYL
mmetsp:Transcript_18117/g.43034  ORF Transcript_18117/g.43034 Transcript_18117/m.43034 type:complete len:257 (-) Transcript_18117:284-1054(-)